VQEFPTDEATQQLEVAAAQATPRGGEAPDRMAVAPPELRPVATKSADEAVRELTGRIPGPARSTPIDWDAVASELGTALPDDYRRLCEHFGAGGFAREIVFTAPGEDPDLGLIPVAEFIAEVQREEREAGDTSHPVFPEPAGALAWGRTPSAHHLCWITDGPPDAWSIVVIDSKAGIVDPTGYLVYRGGVAQFLVDVLTSAFPEAEEWLLGPGPGLVPGAFDPA
jgi:hypothetical protein